MPVPPFEVGGAAWSERTELSGGAMLAFEQVLELAERARESGDPLIIDVVGPGWKRGLEVWSIPAIDPALNQGVVIGFAVEDGEVIPQPEIVVYEHGRAGMLYPGAREGFYLKQYSHENPPLYRRELEFDQLVEMTIQRVRRMLGGDAPAAASSLIELAREAMILPDLPTLTALAREKGELITAINPDAGNIYRHFKNVVVAAAREDERLKNRFNEFL